MKMDIDEINGVIEMFADDEAVDPARLKQALSIEAGRDYFVDVLVMRRFAHGPRGERAVAVAAADRTAPAPQSASLRRWWPVAAGVAILAGVAGYTGGARSVRVSSLPGPPAPQAVVLDVAPARLDAPAPTHVIRLEHGVDWSERSGGK